MYFRFCFCSGSIVVYHCKTYMFIHGHPQASTRSGCFLALDISWGEGCHAQGGVGVVAWRGLSAPGADR